ncbi:hypothetical protein HPB52_013543 [Rhipicephalus sanguineus]|uniref:Uncharacterized protein n=1 Tax=Rhipicephalus sanguineus TaxID=34632 RepID=A0A9D4PEM2_RHISA|nr:hypothetical protein HPB52_013543 [Rhipicephalus sanguineus]
MSLPEALRVFVVPGHVHQQRHLETAHVKAHRRKTARVQRLRKEIHREKKLSLPRSDSFGEEDGRLPRVWPKLLRKKRTPEPLAYADWREALRLPPVSRYVRVQQHAERARCKPHR